MNRTAVCASTEPTYPWLSAAECAVGIFITFEGGDGAGKTTQANLLTEKLSPHATVLLLREPGGTELGDFIYSYVTHQSKHQAEQGFFVELGSPGFPGKVEPLAELFLFAAARAQLVTQVIRPALERGDSIVCDRFVDSTTAYQGFGRKLPRDQVDHINMAATGGLKPDLTILLDIDPDEGLSRVPTKRDRMEGQSSEFHQRVREGYRRIAAEDPNRFLELDATLPSEEIHAHIWEHVSGLLNQQSQITEPAQKLF